MTDFQATNSHVVATSPVTTAASAPKPLSAKGRKQAAEDVKTASIGHCMSQIGEALGYYAAESGILKSSIAGTIESLLRDAMKIGLDVETMYAPSAKRTGEAYTCILQALVTVAETTGHELKTSVRDNYISRMRKFVSSRGAEPLDLFGNIATLKAKAAKPAPDPKSPAERVTENALSPASQSGTAEKLIGVPALHAYLREWTKSNDVGMVAEKYRKVVADVIAMLERELPAITKK